IVTIDDAFDQGRALRVRRGLADRFGEFSPVGGAVALTLPSATLSQGRGNAQRRMRGAGLRLPSPAGRRCRAAADEGGVRASASTAPHPAFGHPLPAGEGQNPFSRREKVGVLVHLGAVVVLDSIGRRDLL